MTFHGTLSGASPTGLLGRPKQGIQDGQLSYSGLHRLGNVGVLLGAFSAAAMHAPRTSPTMFSHVSGSLHTSARTDTKVPNHHTRMHHYNLATVIRYVHRDTLSGVGSTQHCACFPSSCCLGEPGPWTGATCWGGGIQGGRLIIYCSIYYYSIAVPSHHSTRSCPTACPTVVYIVGASLWTSWWPRLGEH